VADAAYLSIGEVLGILLEEFPDVTISKIRFLESQGLIEPERTPSGYRKFYDNDVDLLRAILREQKDNFLPLKVIRDRIESGEIEPDQTGSHTLPRGIRNVDIASLLESPPVAAPAVRDSIYRRTDSPAVQPSVHVEVARVEAVEAPGAVEVPAPVEVPAAVETVEVVAATDVVVVPEVAKTKPTARAPQPSASDEVPSTASELCSFADITPTQLAELEQYGVVASKGNDMYSPDALRVARVAGQLLAHGVDARHLRGWRQSAEREAALFEQLISPLLRQRNPQARKRAFESLEELADLGGDLRSTLMTSLVRNFSDSN
jgi:DNA-binding transcriptional MerR regulator